MTQLQRYIHFPEAHSNKQAVIMQALAKGNGIEEVYVSCGTKFGKTLSGSVAIANAMLTTPSTYLRWVAPIYEQSLFGYAYCKRMIPETIVKFSEGEPSMRVLGEHGGKIKFTHGKDPYSLEGAACDGYVFDEFAKMKKQVYISARTTMTQRGNKSLMLSTPLGCNHFYDGCMEAKAEMVLAKRQGRMPRKLFITARTEDNPFVPKSEIESARKTFGERLYRQYYLAEFLSDSSVFSNFTSCYFTEKMNLIEEFRWCTDDASESDVCIGVDWARQVDYTVMTAIDVKRRRVIGLWRMTKISYTLQVLALKRFAGMFKMVHIILHDKTGVGVALDDMLHETELNFKGITFTNHNKNQFVTNLCLATEAKQIELPYISHLDDEMKSFEVKHTSLGLPTYAASLGSHDDIVMSLLLAHQALEYCSDAEYTIISI